MGEMPPADVIREAWRNLGAQPTRSLLLLVAAAVLVGGPMVVEASWLSGAMERERRFELSGGYTAYASFETPLDAERCLRLSDASYVRAVAGLRELPQVRVDRQPGTRYASFAVTDGGLSALAPGVELDGRDRSSTGRWVVLGSLAAEELGVGEGAILTIEGDTVHAAAVLGADRLRVPRLERAILRPLTDHDGVQECFIELAPDAFDQGLVAVDALVPELGAEERFGPFTLRGSGQAPVEELRGRSHRWGWIATGLALGLLFGVELWARRSELALIRSLGATLANVVALYLVERFLFVWFGLVVGASAAVMVAVARGGGVTPAQAAFIARPGLLAAAITCTWTLALLTVTTTRVGAQTLKDR